MIGNDLQILLFDDERPVLTAFEGLLQAYGKRVGKAVQVVAADTTKKALDELNRHAGTLDLVLTDVMIEGQPDGLMVALNAVNRDLPVIVMSAHPYETFAHATGGLELMDFLPKPPRDTNVFFRMVQRQIGASQVRAHRRHETIDAAVLTVRLRLTGIDAPRVLTPNADLRRWDYAMVSFMFGAWEQAIAKTGGRLVGAVRGQVMVAVFADDGTDTSPSARALNAVQEYQRAVNASSVLNKKWVKESFSAGLVYGPLEFGNLGAHPPGTASLVGRLPQLAADLSARTGRGEIAVVQDWLDKFGWDAFNQGTLRQTEVSLDGLTAAVGVTHRAMG